MAKQIKNAVISALIVGVTVAALGPAGFGILAANAITPLAAASLTFGTTLLGGLVAAASMTGAGTQNVAKNLGKKVTQRSPLAPRQIVYGTTRVGGIILHLETSGTDNSKLHCVVGIAGHQINSLLSVRFNDLNLSTSSSTVDGETVYTCTDGDYTNTENEESFADGRLIRFTFHDGSQTAVDGLADAALASITTDHKFQGIAYIYLEMIFDPEKFGGGIPEISFNVKGKDLYDPRTAAIGTTDAQRSNPALIIRDYLTDTVYGLKATSDEINDTTNAGGFAAAANICDQTITSETRYKADGFADFATNGGTIIEGVLSAMAGKMTYVNGQFNVFAGTTQTPSLTITDDDLLETISISTQPSSGDLYNQVKAVYVDATNDFTSADSPVISDAAFLAQDTPNGAASANFTKMLELQLPFTTSTTMAQRIAKIALNYQRQTMQIEVAVSTQFMRLQPNDFVYLTNDRMGFDQKMFEVLSTNLEPISEQENPVVATKLVLKEAADSVWDFVSGDYITEQTEGSVVETGTYQVTAPTNLSLSQTLAKDATDRKVTITAEWDNNTSPMVSHTEVAYKLNGASKFSALTVIKNIDEVSIPNAVVGSQYNVKARHIDLNGVTSAYTATSNITIAAPTDAPANPSGVSVTTGKALTITLTYTNPNTADLKAVKIYRKTSNSAPSSDTDGLVHTQYGNPNSISTWEDGKANGLTAGTNYYYWVKAVNHSDVNSALVQASPVAATFTDVATTDVVLKAITETKSSFDASEVANTDKVTYVTLGSVSFTDVTNFTDVVLQYTGAIYVQTGESEKVQVRMFKDGSQITNAQLDTGVLGDVNTGTPSIALSFTDTIDDTGSATYSVRARMSSATVSHAVTFYNNHFMATGLKR